MTVKALCGVIYNGELHPAGETFNADTLLPNTEQIIINEQKVSSKAEDPTAKNSPDKQKKRR